MAGPLALLALAWPQQGVVLEADAIRPREVGDAIVYEVERPRLSAEDLQLSCALAVLTLDAARYRLAAEGGLPRDAARQPDPDPQAGGTVLPGRWSRQLLRGLGLPEDETILREVRLIGDVSIATADTRVRAALIVDAPVAGTLTLTDARVDFAAGSVGLNGWPLTLRATRLEERADGSLAAERVLLTTCPDEQPHYGLRLAAIQLARTASGELLWQPEGGWLQALGMNLLPMPTPDFVPGESFLGLHGARGETGRRLGTAFELQFRGREEFGGTRAQWDFLPMASTRRGFPLSLITDLDARDYRGHWEWFFLRDEASDVTGMAKTVGRDGDERWRVRMDNVWDLSERWRLYGVLDLTSDPLVDPEFFHSSWTEGEDVGPELALAHRAADSYAYLGVNPRLDDTGATPLGGFPAAPGPAPRTLETLPRLQWERFATTLAELPVGGGADDGVALNLEYGAELVRLRQRDRELVAPGPIDFLEAPDLTRTRARGWAELAAPVHGAGFFMRPGARLAGALWEDDTPGAEQDQQLTAEAFLELGTALEKRWEDGWAHRVLPQVRLRAREEAVEADAVPAPLDGLDRLAEGEVVEFSLRQFFLAPGAAEPWLDLDLLAPFHPSEGEVLAPLEGPSPWTKTLAEDGFGPAEVRAVWSPGAPGSPLEGVRTELRLRRDLSEHVTQETFTRISVRPDEALFYGLEYYETEGAPADFAYGSVFAGWRFSTSWAVGVRQSENFAGDAGVQTGYALQYYGHDFLFEGGYTRRQATGDVGVYFNVTPRFFFDPYGSRKLARLRWQ